MAEPGIPPGSDFTDPDLYTTRVPMDELAELRRTAPIWWNAQPRGASGFDDDGYWVITRHPAQHRPAAAHQAARDRLAGFHAAGDRPPREALMARAERIVRVAVADGTGDIVTDVAAELPLQAIAELLGIPQEDPRKIFAWSNEMIGYDDPEYDGDGQAAAAELAARDRSRRDRPVGDPGDGVPAHRGRRHRSGWPADQNRPAGRPVLPVGQLRRGGLRRPDRLDILRSPNPHLGFGGTGTHYCLGANLAQLEIDLMFNAIADGKPGIRRAGDAERLRSGWLSGIKRLPVSYQ